MNIEDEMRTAIKTALSPEHLEVINESHLHAGHMGDDGSGVSHFKIIIVSQKFEGVSRIERQRIIHRALGQSIVSRIHALSLVCKV